MKKIFTLLVFIIIAVHVPAQVIWVTPHDSTEIYSFTNTINGLSTIEFRRIDTTTRQIHQYSAENQGFYASLGNVGLPLQTLTPDYDKQPGFNFGRGAMAPYRYQPNTIPYFHSSSPFSEVRYVMGPDKENVLSALYSRNLYRGLTLGLNYRLIHATGPYSRQRADLDNLAITLRYFSKNKHYGILAAIIRNGFDYQPNGGIQNDSDFENNKYTRRPLIAVRLSSADANETSRLYSFTQFWEPTRARVKPTISDTSRVDTLTQQMPDTVPFYETLPRRFFSFGRFIHHLEYSSTSFTYVDKAPNGFYTRFYRNPSTTFDSVSVFHLRNEIAWTNALYLYQSSFPLKLKLGVEYLLAGYNNDSTRLVTFNQLIPSATLRLLLPAGFGLDGRGWWVFGNYNGGDAGLEGKIFKKFSNRGKEWEMAGFARLYTSAPDYFYTRYAGNHQQWDTSWSSQEIVHLGGFLQGPQTLIKPEYYLINNLVYLNHEAAPAQAGGAISLLRVTLEQQISWGHMHAWFEGVWQRSSNTEVLSLPQWLAKSTVSVSGYLFDNALWAEPGITATWYSSYYAPAFMPSISSFYLQNEKKTGNFVVADLFLNAKIARARLFLRYRHFHAAWTGFNYWGAFHYPLSDAGINFGVIWPFYD
ncbi:MAG: putative porin [Bacteroidales bacterium]